MALLFIHATNSEFHACDQGKEYEQPANALEDGIRGAVAMLAEEIYRGIQNAAVEISVRQEDGTSVLRSVVSISIAPLMILGETPEMMP